MSMVLPQIYSMILAYWYSMDKSLIPQFNHIRVSLEISIVQHLINIYPYTVKIGCIRKDIEDLIVDKKKSHLIHMWDTLSSRHHSLHLLLNPCRYKGIWVSQQAYTHSPPRHCCVCGREVAKLSGNFFHSSIYIYTLGSQETISKHLVKCVWILFVAMASSRRASDSWVSWDFHFTSIKSSASWFFEGNGNLVNIFCFPPGVVILGKHIYSYGYHLGFSVSNMIILYII